MNFFPEGSDIKSRIALGALFCAGLLSSFYGAWTMRIYRDRLHSYSPDKVTVYMRRFDEIAPSLKGVRVAGYISDKPDWAYKKLAQYELPATILDDTIMPEYVLGNFHSVRRIPRGYFVSAESASGVVLLRRGAK